MVELAAYPGERVQMDVEGCSSVLTLSNMFDKPTIYARASRRLGRVQIEKRYRCDILDKPT